MFINLSYKKKILENFILVSFNGIVNILIIFLLTDYLVKEDFAKYFVFLSFSNISIIFCTLSMEKNFPSLNRDDVIQNLILITISIIVISTTLSLLFFYLETEFNHFYFLIFIISESINKIFHFLYIRLINVKNSLLTILISSIFYFLIIIYFNHNLDYELILNLALLVSLSKLFIYIFQVWSYKNHSNVKLKLNLNYSHLNYEKIKFFKSDLLLSLTTNLPLIIVSYFNISIAANLALSLKILNTPFQFISKPIGEFFFELKSEIYRTNSNEKLIKITSLNILILTLILLFFLVLSILFFWDVLFGNDWQNAKNYTLILLFPFSIWYVINPLNNIYFILGKSKELFFFQLLAFFSICIPLLFIDIINFNIILFIVAIMLFLRNFFMYKYISKF